MMKKMFLGGHGVGTEALKDFGRAVIGSGRGSGWEREKGTPENGGVESVVCAWGGGEWWEGKKQ